MINIGVLTSKGSFLSSAIKIPELIDTLKSNNHNTLCVADYSMSAVVDLYDICKESNLNLVIGRRFKLLIDDDTEHREVTLYAKNKLGYYELIKYNNAVSGGVLEESKLTKSDNLVFVFSSCSASNYRLFFNKVRCKVYFNKIKEYFNSIYVEVSNNGYVGENAHNKSVFSYRDNLGYDVIFSSNCRYLLEDDQNVLSILGRIFSNSKSSANKIKTKHHYLDCYPEDLKHSNNQFSIEFSQYDIYENNGKMYMPEYDDAEGILNQKCFMALDDYLHENESLSDRNDEYYDRLKFELKVINKESYAGYFLLISDVVDWCKGRDILVGVGRGSAGGSLVSYLLGITGFDPLYKECPLYFERFLNPDRVSPPDIDVDLTDRDAVIEYLSDRFGSDKVLTIGTVMTFGIRSSLKEVAKSYGLNDKILQPLFDVMPVDLGITSNKKLYEENEDYHSIIESNNDLKAVWNYATKIEGLHKNPSIHASGILVCPYDIKVPVSDSNGVKYTQYDMSNVEKLGYIKFDFLGLDTLKIVENTIKKIKITKGIDVDINKVDYWNPDKRTMSLIRTSQTTCVFQWESDGYKSLIQRLKPDTFNELIDLNTLYRPGPAESGLTDQYIRRKHGREKVTYIHDSLSDVLNRQGLPLFQEEIMLLCTRVAGFTMAEADVIRKAIGKKDLDLLAKQQTKFVDGCVDIGGFSQQKASDTWDMLQKFGRYSWNLSHGLAYTIISYWTAYLSANYPAEFFASNMDSKIDKYDRLLVIISEARRRGIKVNPPSVNKSKDLHEVVNNQIYMSFDSIKGVGNTAKNAIIQNRDDHGSYKNFDDFCERVDKSKCNASTKEALIYAGVFDEFKPKDVKTYDYRLRLLNLIINKRNLEKFTKLQRLTPYNMVKEEFDRIGFYVNDTPFHIAKLRIYKNNYGAFEVISYHKHIDKNGNGMLFINATDHIKYYNFIMFANKYKIFGDVKIGMIYLFGYNLDGRDDSVIINSSMLLCDKDGNLTDDAKNKLMPLVDINTYKENMLSIDFKCRVCVTSSNRNYSTIIGNDIKNNTSNNPVVVDLIKGYTL